MQGENGILFNTGSGDQVETISETGKDKQKWMVFFQDTFAKLNGQSSSTSSSRSKDRHGKKDSGKEKKSKDKSSKSKSRSKSSSSKKPEHGWSEHTAPDGEYFF